MLVPAGCGHLAVTQLYKMGFPPELMPARGVMAQPAKQGAYSVSVRVLFADWLYCDRARMFCVLRARP